MEHNAEILKHYSFILREGGGKEKIEFSKKPSGTKVTYNSDNTNVATVNKKGYIAPKGEGTCTVTCTLEYKEKTKELSVFV